jgi:hypothetical protein
MDNQPAPEKFTLIASAKPLPELDFGADKISRSQFQSVIDRIFSNVKNPKSGADGEWTKVEGESQNDPLLRTAFTLKHD